MMNSSRCNQAWSSIKIEVDKYENSKSVIQWKNKIKAWKDQYKKAKENKGKSGEEPKSSPFYDKFDRILSERTWLSLKMSDKKVYSKAQSSANLIKTTKKKVKQITQMTVSFFSFRRGTLPKTDILELLKGYPLCTEFRI